MIGLPLPGAKIHVIGICGIGMSAVAQLFQQRGYTVIGSDETPSAQITSILQRVGIRVLTPHSAANLGRDTALVIISSAIKNSNAELVKARQLGLRVIHRSEAIAMLYHADYIISVSGSHGKTTTATMLGYILEQLGATPTVVVGGVVPQWQGNVLLPSVASTEQQLIVLEADESDGSFLRWHSDISIITSISPEHLDYYGSYQALISAYVTFALSTRHITIVCGDNDNITQHLLPHLDPHKTITYGYSPDSDIQVHGPMPDSGTTDISFSLSSNRSDLAVRQDAVWSFGLYGNHNILNLTAAIIAAAYAMNRTCVTSSKVDISSHYTQINSSLRDFVNANRRFTPVFKRQGLNVIDDYAHHPAEITATISAARQHQKSQHADQIIAILQPHRYTRVQHLAEAMATALNEADWAIITDVYSAGETPLPDVSAWLLWKRLYSLRTTEQLLETRQQNVNAKHFMVTQEHPAEMNQDSKIIIDYQHKLAYFPWNERYRFAEHLSKLLDLDTILLCMGAGNITIFASELRDLL